MIDHLKKGDMANEAERLLEDAGWLPEPMRTPELLYAPAGDPAEDAEAAELPAFLDDEAQPVDDDGDGIAAAA
jgi:ParB family chromosome partitioning protein